MILKIKAFIYRFSNIFGLNIYLAKKEEQDYIDSLENASGLYKNLEIGLWQAENGFTTVWTYKQPLHKAIYNKIKHAFQISHFRRGDD
jgi:hypothetical protein